MALRIMKDAITASAPKKAGARRVPREETPDMDPISPDDDDNSDDRRKRSNISKKHDSDDNGKRRISNRRDARDKITHKKVNRGMRRCATREEYSDEQAT